MSTQAAPSEAKSKQKVAAWDVDVHHGWTSRADLYPHLSVVYRDRLSDYGIGAGMQMGSDHGNKGYREDALPDGKVPEGTAVASPSVELTRKQLLDACGIEWALLTGGQVSTVSAHPDLDFASALASAYNAYTVENWLAADARFRLALTVNARDPKGAVAEIERLGDHEQVVAVMFPGGAMMPFGQRYYHPIYEACAERNLVVCIHVGSEGMGVNPSPTAAGYPSFYAENAVARSSLLQVHITSFVFEGVFERFPNLRLAILEGGFGWVAPYLWYMDQTWEDLRAQTPWVKRPPSEYVLDHVRFSSRPAEQPMLDSAIDDILDWVSAEKTLLFSSDYPRWDWSDPATVFTSVDDSLRERILAGNAKDWFRSS